MGRQNFAGSRTVKNRKPRTVPLHEHLTKQGFVRFAKASGEGPLFYNEPNGKTDDADPTNPKRPRAVKARERVAAWVREIGVADPELQPNHAWRHTFKKLGDRAGIPRRCLTLSAAMPRRVSGGATARRTFLTRQTRCGGFRVSSFDV